MCPLLYSHLLSYGRGGVRRGVMLPLPRPPLRPVFPIRPALWSANDTLPSPILVAIL